MAGMERQFRDGFAAQQTPDSEGPSDVQGAADEGEGADLTCPMCGASAKKIAQAAMGGGGGKPPMPPMGGM